MKRLDNGKFVERCIDCPHCLHIQKWHFCNIDDRRLQGVNIIPLWCDLEDKETENGETANQRKTAD